MTTPDFPPRKGGIQLLCQRLVEHSGFSYEVVALGDVGSGKHSRDTRSVIRVAWTGDRHLAVMALNATTIRRALATRPDAVVSAHIVAGPGALAVQRLTGTPAIQYLHSSELGARPRLTRVISRAAAASIAVSEFTKKQAVTLGAPSERLRVILPGVDAARAIEAGPALNGRRTIITVARLEDRYKGFDVLVRALPLVQARVPDVRWVLVGDGPLRHEIAALAAGLGVSHLVTFAGMVDDRSRDRLLAQADVFAMPSRLIPGGRGGEGFGIAYLEAGVHRLPCVVGNVGGAAEAVVNGETGLAVDPTDHVAVADALSKLLINPELRDRLGEGGHRRALDLSWTRMAREVDQLIEDTVRQSRLSA